VSAKHLSVVCRRRSVGLNTRESTCTKAINTKNAEEEEDSYSSFVTHFPLLLHSQQATHSLLQYFTFDQLAEP
jgi:hypothetical protein